MDNSSTSNGDRPRLQRRVDSRMAAGVAAGLGDYLNVDVTLVRVAFLLLGVLGGAGVPLYAALWLLVPEEGNDRALVDDLIHPHEWI